MILLDVKKYIKTHEQVTGEQICNRFDLSESSLEGIVAPLIEQGHVTQVKATDSCGSGKCNSGCSFASSDNYYWTTQKLKAINIPIQS